MLLVILKIPPSKESLLTSSQNEILESDLAYARGEITSVERFQKVIDTWNNTKSIELMLDDIIYEDVT